MWGSVVTRFAFPLLRRLSPSPEFRLQLANQWGATFNPIGQAHRAVCVRMRVLRNPTLSNGEGLFKFLLRLQIGNACTNGLFPQTLRNAILMYFISIYFKKNSRFVQIILFYINY